MTSASVDGADLTRFADPLRVTRRNQPYQGDLAEWMHPHKNPEPWRARRLSKPKQTTAQRKIFAFSTSCPGYWFMIIMPALIEKNFLMSPGNALGFVVIVRFFLSRLA